MINQQVPLRYLMNNLQNWQHNWLSVIIWNLNWVLNPSLIFDFFFFVQVWWSCRVHIYTGRGRPNMKGRILEEDELWPQTLKGWPWSEEILEWLVTSLNLHQWDQLTPEDYFKWVHLCALCASKYNAFYLVSVCVCVLSSYV